MSIREVAAAAAVSVGTVSNVLNSPEKVSPATVARVQAAIDALGFVRNDAARQLRAGRSRSVGLVVLDVGNPFFTDIARGAGARAADHRLTLLLATSDDDPRRERSHIDAFAEQRVFGLLVSPIGDDFDRLETLRRRGTPVVLVDRDGAGTEFDSVAVDDIAGGTLAAEHLAAIGRRRIAFVGGSPELRQVRDRLQGARDTLARVPGAGLEVIPTAALTIAAGSAVGRQILDRPPAQRPDGIFCANDLLALGVLQTLTVFGGLAVPGDIALVGYDDIEFAGSAVVPLTSVRQPRIQIGCTAIDLLIEAAAAETRRPNHVLFGPELVVRLSTGGATPAGAPGRAAARRWRS